MGIEHDKIMALDEKEILNIILKNGAKFTERFIKKGCYCVEPGHEEDVKEIQKIQDCSIEDSIILKKTIEHPLIKGSGEHKVTKGFIDVIFDMKSFSTDYFSCYCDINTYQFLIDIKTENDFKDVGAIIRQIKEYKSYYGNPCPEWNGLGGNKIRYWCIMANKIPPMARKMFYSEDIISLELDTNQKILNIDKKKNEQTPNI